MRVPVVLHFVVSSPPIRGRVFRPVSVWVVLESIPRNGNYQAGQLRVLQANENTIFALFLGSVIVMLTKLFRQYVDFLRGGHQKSADLNGKGVHVVEVKFDISGQMDNILLNAEEVVPVLTIHEQPEKSGAKRQDRQMSTAVPRILTSTIIQMALVADEWASRGSVRVATLQARWLNRFRW